MNCSGVWPSGTAYITFEGTYSWIDCLVSKVTNATSLDVRVPKENLIGKESKGFKYIMQNFVSERMGIIIQATRFSRVCIEESIKVYFIEASYCTQYCILTFLPHFFLVRQQEKNLWQKADRSPSYS